MNKQRQIAEIVKTFIYYQFQLPNNEVYIYLHITSLLKKNFSSISKVFQQLINPKESEEFEPYK